MSPSARPRIAVVGGGVVGGALGRALREAGYPVVAVASRSKRSAQATATFIGGDPAPTVLPGAAEAAASADVVLVTVPDRAIPEVAAAVAAGGPLPGAPLLVHCAGALPADVLAPVRAVGAEIGAMHPLQSFAAAEAAVAALKGTVFGIEGPDAVRPRLAALVTDLGGVPLEVSAGKKALYHAAAAMISNYGVALAAVASEVLVAAGAPPDQALKALLPLLTGTVANLGKMGVPTALTGPIARGDLATVRAHLDALKRDAPEALSVYAALGRHAVRLARAKGSLAAEDADVLRAMLARHDA